MTTSRRRQRAHVGVIVSRREGQGPINIGATDAFDEIARKQLAATVRHLAVGLPLFEAVFGLEGDYAVTKIDG